MQEFVYTSPMDQTGVKMDTWILFYTMGPQKLYNMSLPNFIRRLESV